jgi:hypothetical protein
MKAEIAEFRVVRKRKSVGDPVGCVDEKFRRLIVEGK